jgi:glycerol-3-phosphate acyltransferase PlsY
MFHVKNATRIFFFFFLVVLYTTILTSENNHFITLCFAAYGLGSIPFGYILARFFNHDLSKIGSGNIGATNVLRTGNKGLAALTLILDAAKGWLAVLWLGSYEGIEYLPYIVALIAILGHLYPIWLDFKGGKGVATGLGVLFALQWPLALTAAGLWVLFAFLLRISSLAALLTVAILPIIAFIFTNEPTALFCLIMGTLIFISHKSNIYRLIGGKESRIGQR